LIEVDNIDIALCLPHEAGQVVIAETLCRYIVKSEEFDLPFATTSISYVVGDWGDGLKFQK